MSKVCIIEGFDMTGKSTFISTQLPGYRLYHCRHDLIDETVGRQNSWIIGYGIIDLLEQIGIGNGTTRFKNGVVIDRGVFSSYVYDRLYRRSHLDPKIIEWYKNNEFFKTGIEHVYLKHHSTDTARILFEKSKSREVNPNALSNKYDQFNSFDDYWIYYTTADLLYQEIYKLIGIKPRVFEAMGDMTWKEVVTE